MTSEMAKPDMVTYTAVVTPETFDGVVWVWLDLDDTLYDFCANSLESLHELYENMDLKRWWPTVDSWCDHYHRINARLWDLYAPGKIDRDTLRHDRFYVPLTEAGCQAVEADRLCPIMDGMYLRLLGQKSRTCPGARELLLRLRRRGFKIGILSNGFKQVQYDKLKSTGLYELTDCVTLSDEIDVNKPNKAFFDYAASKVGDTAPSHHMLIGDNADTDIAGAVAACWKSIWYRPDRASAKTPPAVTVPVVSALDCILPDGGTP